MRVSQPTSDVNPEYRYDAAADDPYKHEAQDSARRLVWKDVAHNEIGLARGNIRMSSDPIHRFPLRAHPDRLFAKGNKKGIPVTRPDLDENWAAQKFTHRSGLSPMV